MALCGRHGRTRRRRAAGQVCPRKAGDGGVDLIAVALGCGAVCSGTGSAAVQGFALRTRLTRHCAHAARYRAGPLCALDAADTPPPPRWLGPAALVLCILGGDDADAPPQRCTATLWEFPLPDDADAPASATALPPPRLAATWTDVFASPPRPAGDARLSTNVSPTMCFMSASQPCVTPEGAIALRDVATGDVAALRGAEDINVASLRNVVVDARPGGARHVLLESRTQQFTLLDADSGALLKAFSLPQTQMPLMYIDSPAWVSAPTRYLITGQAVLLPPDGNDTRCLTSATRSDGRSIPAATARAAAAAARAHAAAAPHDPWGPPPAPKVAIYRLFSCISGALQSRIVLPLNIPVREDAPFQFNGQFISSDWVCPGADVISTLLWEPGAGGTARVLLSRNGDCAPAIPLPAVFVQRHPDMPQADGGLPPFSFSVADAATWRWVVLSDTVHAEGAPGGASAALHHELTPPADARCGAADITVLDFLPRA